MNVHCGTIQMLYLKMQRLDSIESRFSWFTVKGAADKFCKIITYGEAKTLKNP